MVRYINEIELTSVTADNEAMLCRIIRTVYSTTDLHKILQILVQELGSLLQADRCFILRKTSESSWEFLPQYEYLSSSKISSLLLEPQIYPLADELFFSSHKNASDKIVEFECETSGLCQKTIHFLQKNQVQSGLSYRISYQGRCLAILYLHHIQEKWLWSEQEKQIIQIIGHQAAITLHRAELHENLRLFAKQKEGLAEISRLSLFDNPVFEIMNHAAALVGKTLQINGCFLFESLSQNNAFKLYTAIEDGVETLCSNDTLIFTNWYQKGMLIPGKPIFLEGEKLLQQFPDIGRNCYTSALFFTMPGCGQAFGLIGFFSKGRQDFLKSDVGFLKILTSILAKAIERQQMESAFNALKESEARYKLIVDESNEKIWDWDILKNETYWNDCFFDMLGLDRLDPKTNYETFFDLVHPEDRKKVQESIQAHLEENKKYEVYFRLKHVDGQYRYCFSRGKALRNSEGVPVRMAGVVLELTE